MTRDSALNSSTYLALFNYKYHTLTHNHFRNDIKLITDIINLVTTDLLSDSTTIMNSLNEDNKTPSTMLRHTY